MSVYIIHPMLTIGENLLAKNFYEVCYHELNQHVNVTEITQIAILLSIEVRKEDCVIFFNREDQSYEPAIIDMLVEALTAKAELCPIAITITSRKPPEILSKVQSFDISEQLRHRCLSELNMATVALSLARTIISRLQPTLCKEEVHLFISHRRADGEEIAAIFCRKLRQRAESVFRDLIDIMSLLGLFDRPLLGFYVRQFCSLTLSGRVFRTGSLITS